MKEVPSFRFQVPSGWIRLALTALLTFRLSAAGAAPVADFDQASKLYEQGQYAEAAAAYEKLIEAGTESPTLWFNLGNARFKAGELGRAVAAYRQAEALSPRDPDVRFNLQFVRKQVLGTDAPNRPWLARIVSELSLNEWTLLACGGGWLCFGLLALGQWRPAARRRFRNWAIGVGLATVLPAAGLAGAIRQRYFERFAVIVTREVPVRQGPLDESKPAFTARDGTEVQVLDQLNGWWQVRDWSGRVGWVREKSAMRITLR